MPSLLTSEQDAYLREIVKGRSTKECTDMLNTRFDTDFKESQIKGYKGNHGISSGLTGRFEKGHVPINKNKKGMFNVGGNRTSYKTGQMPKNTDPIGTEKEMKGGYIWVKIDDQLKPKNKQVNWKPKHQLIYEKEHGKIPEGYKCLFLDGNNHNFDINNIVAITKAECLYLNRHGLISSDPEITRSGIALAKAMCKVNDCKKMKQRRKI